MDDNFEPFEPQPGDRVISIPVTFDYRGGRASNVKNKVVTTLISTVLSIFICVLIARNSNLEFWQKLIYSFGVCYIGLLIIRMVVMKELYFSDIYEKLKADDFELRTEDIWQIFDIDFNYPYTCFFRNGQKGIFVRMERDAITGKPDNADFYHYDAISEAYKIAHSLNMNIVHIDYMDNIGNDTRLQNLYNDLNNVENPDMQDMLIDIYDNLQEEMSRNYSSFDIYLFLTRDKFDNFMYNVQTVANRMLGGNYITFKFLNRQEISGVCTALFNLHDFSIVEACENVLSGDSHSGIIPISLTKSDGTVEVFNKTSEQKRIEHEEFLRKQEEAKKERAKKKSKDYVEPMDKIKDSDESLDLFGSDDNTDLFGTNDDLNLFK